MDRGRYEYSLVLFGPDDKLLGQFEARVSFAAAVEWVRFRDIRRGLLPPVLIGQPGDGDLVEPIWQDRSGPPYVAGFRVQANRRTPESSIIRLEYVRPLARAASRTLVEAGKLRDGDTFTYIVMALPCERTQDSSPERPRFSVRPRDVPLVLLERDASSLRERATCSGGNPDPTDLPVYVHKKALHSAISQTLAAGTNETGGVLVGHLCRRSGHAEIWVEVIDQIPARHAISELTRLSFTADTWAAAREDLAARGHSEQILGWWHCHTFAKETCKNCPEARDRDCSGDMAFMSSEDCALHETIFPRAYMVSLVIADSPCAGLTWRIFGWQSGMIMPRAFHIVHETDERTSETGANHASQIRGIHRIGT